MSRLEQIFSIDVRSLALVRVALAVIILQDLVRRAFDITVFYGDAGVLPTEYTHTFWNGALSWSLHLIAGGPEWLLVTLFLFHALAALALFFGLYTRAATIAVWLLTVSLHNANPLILQGEDVLLRVVLFVCIFLPLGAAYSIDRWRSREERETTVLSGWTIAYLLQIGFMYFFVALYKHSPEWLQGDAIYYALSIDQYATPLGKYLLNFPAVLSFFTVAVVVFQSFALFLLFSPYKTMWVRSVTVFFLMLMHAAFAVSMNLGMFSAVSIAALAGFLPSEMWNALERFVRTRVNFGAHMIERLSATAPAERNVSRAQAFVSILGVVYLFYIFFWHGLNVVNPGQYVAFSHGFEIPAQVLRIDQRWNLFAPYPYRDDGWIVVDAVREDGTHIDLFRDGAPVSYVRPEVIYDLYPRPRWRRFFLSLRHEGNAQYRTPYAQYLCREWRTERAKIESLTLIYMREWTPAPGEVPEPVRQIPLISWNCAAGSR